MRKFKQEGARLRWKRIIEDHQESGLSVKEYCRQHGLNLTCFHRKMCHYPHERPAIINISIAADIFADVLQARSRNYIVDDIISLMKEREVLLQKIRPRRVDLYVVGELKLEYNKTRPLSPGAYS
jgi:hypothetical protein